QPAADAAAPPPENEPTFGNFLQGFHIRRSSTDEGSAVGAQFSLTKDNSDTDDHKHTVYSADFYITNNLKDSLGLGNNFPDLSIFIEGHLASTTEASENSWRAGFELENYSKTVTIDREHRKEFLRGIRANPFSVQGIYWKVNAELDADRDFRTEQIILDGALTINAFGLGIGMALPTEDPDHPVP